MFREALASLGVILALIALMATIQLVNFQLEGALERYGILPRSTDNLPNIFSAPFVHASNSHLLSNIFGLLVFGSLVAFRSRWLFVWGSLFIISVSGGMAWLIGREALHIGASGWIYGLWSLTIGIAWFDRRLINIAIALVVLVVYGSMSYGLLPLQPTVSFEMHIAGAIAGVICAYCYQQIMNRRRDN